MEAGGDEQKGGDTEVESEKGGRERERGGGRAAIRNVGERRPE